MNKSPLTNCQKIQLVYDNQNKRMKKNKKEAFEDLQKKRLEYHRAKYYYLTERIANYSSILHKIDEHEESCKNENCDINCTSLSSQHRDFYNRSEKYRNKTIFNLNRNRDRALQILHKLKFSPEKTSSEKTRLKKIKDD
jgi:hypothetical protein